MPYPSVPLTKQEPGVNPIKEVCNALSRNLEVIFSFLKTKLLLHESLLL